MRIIFHEVYTYTNNFFFLKEHPCQTQIIKESQQTQYAPLPGRASLGGHVSLVVIGRDDVELNGRVEDEVGFLRRGGRGGCGLRAVRAMYKTERGESVSVLRIG